MERTGRCLCGSVTYTAQLKNQEFGACHCTMCRRWSGAPFVAIGANEIAWTGDDKLRTFTSSDWAERGFCTECGSNLFYRVTTGPHRGMLQLAFGTLDEQDGFQFEQELFIDEKPDSYGFDGDRRRLTTAEVLAMFGAE